MVVACGHPFGRTHLDLKVFFQLRFALDIKITNMRKSAGLCAQNGHRRLLHSLRRALPPPAQPPPTTKSTKTPCFQRCAYPELNFIASPIKNHQSSNRRRFLFSFGPLIYANPEDTPRIPKGYPQNTKSPKIAVFEYQLPTSQ